MVVFFIQRFNSIKIRIIYIFIYSFDLCTIPIHGDYNSEIRSVYKDK